MRSGAAPRRGRFAPAAVLAAALALVACSSPVGVEPLSLRAAHRALTVSALSADRPSIAAENTLRARGLLEQAKQDPDGALRALHELVVSGKAGADEIFVLSELSFLHGMRTGKREQYLAAAVYAWAYLFPGRPELQPSSFDPRTRVACDLYNQGLVSAFRTEKDNGIELRAGTWELPFGKLEIAFDEKQLRWGSRQLVDFIDLSRLEVRGLRNHYRHPGLGAPLAAHTARVEGGPVDDLFGPRILASLTLILDLGDASAALSSGNLTGRLELFPLHQAESFEVGGRQVPLEQERTTALAATLDNPLIWKAEIWGFFGRMDETGVELPALRATAPHAAGRIPVVFVHGTASSPGRWADMVNDLWDSPWIRQRFEPWFFMYDTGNPIPYSGALLREKLSSTVQRLDPRGGDACLQQMVVIGHSQGGLLTKLTAIDTGDRLWSTISKKPLAELKLSGDTRKLMQSAFFLEPLPFVRRVVFIATPHQGSYQALSSPAYWIQRFIRMPKRLVGLASELSLNTDDMLVAGSMLRMPTSIDNMREGNRFLTALAAIPVAPGIPRHSIIPVLGDGPLAQAKDGVVAYESAHIADADSELVVHSGHSAQGLPATIEEVRRILELHARTLEDQGVHCGEPSLSGS
jgi:pimeloyl-ACP methyl ester carboxylesterase